MFGAALTIFAFLFAPGIIKKAGNYTTALWAVLFQIFIFYGLISATSPLILATLFAMQAAVTAVISICLDIFLEVYTDGKNVGAVRGIYNTSLNASWIIGPLIGTMLINGTENYRNTYVAALAMLFPLMYMIFKNFPKFHDPNYTHLSPHQLLRHVSKNKNLVKLFSANLVLQIFYSWMVVYSPIYLHDRLGFTWEQIGIILIVMLLPFALIQYPLGKLADKKYGEKGILVIGFIVLGIATITLSFIDSHSVWVWAFGLFATRMGAAAAEIMMETYFFKTVPTTDSASLGMFRLTRPLATFIAPLITVVGLLYVTHQYLFVILGLVVLIAIIPSVMMKNVR